MIICVCNNVNETAIRRAVADGHATYEALQFELAVGTCCGTCEHAARDTLKRCSRMQSQPHAHTPVLERLEHALRPATAPIRIQPA